MDCQRLFCLVQDGEEGGQGDIWYCWIATLESATYYLWVLCFLSWLLFWLLFLFLSSHIVDSFQMFFYYIVIHDVKLKKVHESIQIDRY